jgi:hypothetical protein
MSVPDDSALLHRRAYDPIKAREYYLRNRHLKGRRKGTTIQPTAGKASAPPRNPGWNRPSRRDQMEREKEALESRLDQLKEILAAKVKAAKARSGVESPSDKKEKKDQKETAAKNEKNKKDKPLTAAEKRKKAKEARDQYKKEHASLGAEIQSLQRQIADVRADIQDAIEDARKKAQSNSRRR